MQAEPPPAIVAPADDSAIIEIVGTRSDQAQKIDRRTYRVKDNAQAAQADTLQLLRGLPAIVITPDDQILLLGSGSVTVLVDDKPVQGDITQYLRTLRGSDIERIEVITNPSAQYAAQGSGGIINIVLRRNRADGTTGSASLLGSSQGRVEGSASVKVKRGKWGFEGQAQATVGRFAPSRYRSLRTVEEADGSTTVNSTDGTSGSRVTNIYLNGVVSHEFDPRTKVSLTASGGINRFRSANDTDYVGLAGDFDSFSARQRSLSRSSFRYAQLDLDHNGTTEGETLKGYVSAYTFGTRRPVSNRFDDGGGYDQESRDRQTGVNSKLDWVHPIGTTRILSVGARLDYDVTSRHLLTTEYDPGGGPPIGLADAFRTRDFSSAAYATYQMKFGQWSVMPGVRAERFDRRITSPDRPTVAIVRTDLFPSFHLERPFGKKFNLTASYARRIDRPNPSQLRPYPIRRGALFFERGNPDLRDQTNDNYEINLTYRHKTLNLGLILFDRETHDLWDNSYGIDADGIAFSVPINAGRKSNRGAQFDIGLPLLKRVKGTASVNLFNSVVPYDTPTGTTRFSQFRYAANATLNWTGKERGKLPGDLGQVQLEYESRSRTFQLRNSASISANFSYTRNLSKTVALTGSVNGIGAGRSRSRLIAPTIEERNDARTRQPEIKLKLVKTFGPKS